MIIAALLAALGSIELVPSKEIEIPEGLVDRGEMSDDLKRLYSLRATKAAEHNDFLKRFEGCEDVEERQKLAPELRLLTETAKALDEILWFEIKAEFDIFDREQIYIGAGWHVFVDTIEYPICPGCGTRHKPR